MSLPTIKISHIEGKGLGVFAASSIPANEIIEIAKAHPVRTEHLDLGPHWEHVFPWDREHWAVVAGYAHFINHSDDPNCYWWVDRRRMVCTIKTMRDVFVGEELTIDYGFTAPPGFEVLP